MGGLTVRKHESKSLKVGPIFIGKRKCQTHRGHQLPNKTYPSRSRVDTDSLKNALPKSPANGHHILEGMEAVSILVAS